MREADQIPRNSLAWLLLAQAVILAPHVVHVPLWIWGVWLFVVFWRWQIFRGAWGFPGWAVKLVLVASSSAGLYLVYRGSFGVQTMVGLLIVGFILKLIEMRKRGDLLLLCHLGYFVIATQFLFFSSVFAALYGLLSLTVLSATLLASHQSLDQHRFWRTLRLTGMLVLQAIPLMLLLFLIAPRVGPLWAVPVNSSAAKSGMSDTMSPGDISQLSRSAELVFRATFDGDVPPQSELYWRGLVFSHFDGRRWSQSNAQISRANINWQDQERADWRDELRYEGREYRYQVIIEPTQQPWLLSLTAPQQWDSEAGLTQELSLQRKRPITQRIQYRITSSLAFNYQADQLEDWQRRQALQLPGGSNPRTREIAEQWQREAGSAEALIERLLQHYNASFRYTLQPPILGQESVDEFLWQTQKGFCEHFASSFVFFMRAAGIPARVVVGYQGGEYNPLENYFAVRQREAHAWSEVWLPGRGWVRIDPTAAVAPERIEQGVDFSLNEEDSQLLDNSFASGISLLNTLRLRWEGFNYLWSRWVLGYNAETQGAFLERLLGGMDIWRIALFVLVAGALIIGAIMLFLLWGQRKRYHYPADRYYQRFCNKLARSGFSRQPGEAPRDFAQRVSQQRPDLSTPLYTITELYEWASYAGNQAALVDLKRAVTRFVVRPGLSS